MEEKKSLKIYVFSFLLLLAIIVIIVMACYIYIEKTNFNKEITSLEENITNMQSIIDAQQERINSSSNPDDEIEEDTTRILVENHINHSGMPGPNGATDWGTSRFIASDGWIYEYTYNEYSREGSYPKEENIEILSKELIAKAKRTEDKLTDEDLKLVKDYIRNIEEEKEEIEIKEAKSSLESNIGIADYMENKNFVMYNYASGEKMPIDPEAKSGIFYESSSITKILDIVYMLY